MAVSDKVKMIDITRKEDVVRIAIAEGEIKLKKGTIKAIIDGKIEKGDVLSTATVAAVLAVKKTPEILPLCHPIPITNVKVDFSLNDDRVKVRCQVKSVGKTGVEMEALVGVSVALLTIWDMVKGLEKDEKGQYPETFISNIRVIKKIKSL